MLARLIRLFGFEPRAGHGETSFPLVAFDKLTAKDAEHLVSVVSARLLERADRSPRYFDDIFTEEDAKARQGSLPLCSVWNERVIDDHVAFSLSINAAIVASVLAEYLPRSACEFRGIRDTIISIVSETTNLSLVKACAPSGCMPSLVCAQLASYDALRGRQS